MTKEVVTATENTPVGQICELLIRNKLSGLPVVDKGRRIVGFVSERNIIAQVSSKDFMKKTAKDVMSKEVLYVKEDMPADEISKAFAQTPYRNIPVVRGKKVVGIVSRKDMINRLLGQYY